MKDTFYFSHDYNARNDPKLQRLMMVHGLAGIGAFWCIIEMLYEQGGRMKMDDVKMIAFSIRCEEAFVESLINDFGLFVCSDGEFFSESVAKRILERKEEAERRKKGALKRWNNKKKEQNNDANAMQAQCEHDANAMQAQCEHDANAMRCNAIKGKERKGKEIKGNNTISNDIVSGDKKTRCVFEPPTIEEVKAYIKEKNYSMSAERFFAFYESKGWFVGKNKMKNWKAAVSGWENREKDERQRNQSKRVNSENEKFSNNEWK